MEKSTATDIRDTVGRRPVLINSITTVIAVLLLNISFLVFRIWSFAPLKFAQGLRSSFGQCNVRQRKVSPGAEASAQCVAYHIHLCTSWIDYPLHPEDDR